MWESKSKDTNVISVGGGGRHGPKRPRWRSVPRTEKKSKKIVFCMCKHQKPATVLIFNSYLLHPTVIRAQKCEHGGFLFLPVLIYWAQRRGSKCPSFAKVISCGGIRSNDKVMRCLQTTCLLVVGERARVTNAATRKGKAIWLNDSIYRWASLAACLTVSRFSVVQRFSSGEPTVACILMHFQAYVC